MAKKLAIFRPRTLWVPQLRNPLKCCTTPRQATKEKGTLAFSFKLRRHDHQCPGAKNCQFFGQFEDTFLTFPWNLIEKTLAPTKGVKIYFLLDFPTLPIFVVPLPRGPPWENLKIWRDLREYPLIFLIFLHPESAPGLTPINKVRQPNFVLIFKLPNLSPRSGFLSLDKCQDHF